MTISNYEFIRKVGKGSFGKVYLVKHRHERKHYCLKVIKLEGIPRKEREACRHEVTLLQKMMHPNIVGFKESFLAKNGRELCIVMTFCDGGDLSDRLKQNKRRPFEESQILHWFVQMALGLHFMHNKRVLHRDIKTQNIFLLGNGRLVLGDLGISKVLAGPTSFARTAIGTPYYMSPELFKNRPYNHKSDVWALGCVLYEMATLKHAFDANSLNGLAKKVQRGYFKPLPRTLSKQLSTLVKQMLSLNPSSRPSVAEVLKMPLVKKHVFYFLRDIAQRPSAGMGDGTLVLRAAAMRVADINGQTIARAQSGSGILGARQILSLKQQLESLGMNELVHRAFSGESISRNPAPTSSGRSARDRERLRAAERESERRRIAQEQRDALEREKERKRAVERALEKLRREREIRAAERARRAERARKREAEKRARERRQLSRKDSERLRAQRRAQQRIRNYKKRKVKAGRRRSLQCTRSKCQGKGVGCKACQGSRRLGAEMESARNGKIGSKCAGATQVSR